MYRIIRHHSVLSSTRLMCRPDVVNPYNNSNNISNITKNDEVLCLTQPMNHPELESKYISGRVVESQFSFPVTVFFNNGLSITCCEQNTRFLTQTKGGLGFKYLYHIISIQEQENEGIVFNPYGDNMKVNNLIDSISSTCNLKFNTFIPDNNVNANVIGVCCKSNSYSSVIINTMGFERVLFKNLVKQTTL